ncbi:hypothetical protein ACFE04_024406 [Oxalis oulophora]
MKKINTMLRKCKSLSKQLGRSSSYSSLRSKSTRDESWSNNINKQVEDEPLEVIFVGSTRKRYAISSKYLNHPLLNALIERSKQKNIEEEILLVKCEVVLFDHLLWMLENSDPNLILDSLEEFAELYIVLELLLVIEESPRRLEFPHDTDATDHFKTLKVLCISSRKELFAMVWKHFLSEIMEELFDPNLMLHEYRNRHIKDELWRVVHIGLLCTQESVSLRPTMSKALQMLTKKDEPLPNPTNHPFIDERTMGLDTSEDPSYHLNANNSGSQAILSHSSFYPR